MLSSRNGLTEKKEYKNTYIGTFVFIQRHCETNTAWIINYLFVISVGTVIIGITNVAPINITYNSGDCIIWFAEFGNPLAK